MLRQFLSGGKGKQNSFDLIIAVNSAANNAVSRDIGNLVR
jgi:hypothetical protein